MKIYVVVFCLLLSRFCAYAQQDVLTTVQENRFASNVLIDKGEYDSAYHIMKRNIGIEKYTHPYDYLCYAICAFQVKDTTQFIVYLDKTIQSGIDTQAIQARARKLPAEAKTYLRSYLGSRFSTLRAEGFARYDTVLINEMRSIAEMDQFLRTIITRSMIEKKKTDSNLNYYFQLAKAADSINFVRLKRLFESGKYPGYHNCGAFCDVVITLMHVSDYNNNFDVLFPYLKKEVLNGNISPDEVALIADSHFQRGDGNIYSYYGHWIGRTTKIHDCKNVNKRRAEIGLEKLETEYFGKNRKLPECLQL